MSWQCLRVLRFKNHLFHRATTIISRHLSTSTAGKREVKTINELPGHPNLFGFGTGLGIILARITTRQPFGALILPGQFLEVEKFGPIYKLHIPGLTIVNLADPVEVARVLRNEPKYPKRFEVPALEYYRELRKTVPGVFFANGEDWYRYRSTVSKRILKPREVIEYVPVLNDIVSDFITRLNTIRMPAGTDTEYEVNNLDNELFKWSFESVAHVLFDRRFGCLGDEVNPQAQDFINSVGEFLSSIIYIGLLPVWFYKIYKTKNFKNFAFHFDNMYKYVELFINERVKEVERERSSRREVEECLEENTGFVEYLLLNCKLSKDDLIASIIDLFFAGIDTTSNTLQWFLYMMAKNQDKQEKLFQEVSQVLEDNELPTSKTLAKMPYLKACFKETLRLYPVLSQTSRIIPTDMEIGGYHIPKGTQIQFLHYYMCRSEKYFKNPNNFIPDRWLRDGKRECPDSAQAFASIPFGFGTRMCAGRRIAELEMYLLATRLVQQYEIHYPNNEVVEPFMRGVTIPDRSVRVKFIKRQ